MKIDESKRYLPIKHFCAVSGLSYKTVDYMCKTGQLNFITTESGHRRIDTHDNNMDMVAIKKN